MKRLIMRLVEDFNEYSEIVALNYAKMEEGKCNEGTLQWNRGSLSKIEEYLKIFAADTNGVNLKFEFKEHTFGYDDWKRQLEYRTVRIIDTDLETTENRISNETLRQLCIENQWFTEGTNSQYERLFEMNSEGASIEHIAAVIWICSNADNNCRRDIILKLHEAGFTERMSMSEEEHLADWLDI